jgi:hypothetical protein
MGLVLASGTAVFALLDWTAFGRNRIQFTVSMSTITDAMAAYARLASPFLVIDDHGGNARSKPGKNTVEYSENALRRREGSLLPKDQIVGAGNVSSQR